MSTHPPGGQSGFESGPVEPPAGAGSGGVCASCGRPLPPPDLEAVAAEIDHTLSLEAGRLVARAAWAGRPPDGLLDSLFPWLPAVRARRRLWERGQQLWAERMTVELSGPCPACRGAGVPPMAEPGATIAQPYAPSFAEAPAAPLDQPTTAMPSYGAPSTSPDTPSRPVRDVPPGLDDEAEPATRAVTPLPESATTAMPAMSEPPAAQPLAASEPPPPSADEHEAHTVMISALPSIAGVPRLVVLDGPVHGRQFSLGRPTTTIGRSIGCHVTVEADAVAYDHARIVRGPAGWRIEPIGGAATYVNDEPITAPRTLAAGDLIRIGPARLRFEQAG